MFEFWLFFLYMLTVSAVIEHYSLQFKCEHGVKNVTRYRWEYISNQNNTKQIIFDNQSDKNILKSGFEVVCEPHCNIKLVQTRKEDSGKYICFVGWTEVNETNVDSTEESEGKESLNSVEIEKLKNGDKFSSPLISVENTRNHHYVGQRNERHEPHGYGSAVFETGRRYDGDFKNGKRHNRGICRFKNRAMYIGEWKDDKIHGKGVFIHFDGSIYEGEYVNELRCGKGMNMYANGNKYEGEWKNNRRHGQGIFTDIELGVRYCGSWKDGMYMFDGQVEIL